MVFGHFCALKWNVVKLKKVKKKVKKKWKKGGKNVEMVCSEIVDECLLGLCKEFVV